MLNLIHYVRDFYVRQATKRSLHTIYKFDTPEEYADAEINKMTNVELIEALDDALADRMRDYMREMLNRGA